VSTNLAPSLGERCEEGADGGARTERGRESVERGGREGEREGGREEEIEGGQ
jgi:hypothetical protein